MSFAESAASARMPPVRRGVACQSGDADKVGKWGMGVGVRHVSISALGTRQLVVHSAVKEVWT